jgi:FemAB-related protein (PEP-CTERM system-associated)
VRVAAFEGTPERWDRAVESLDGATFCHLVGWREVMADALGHECLYRVAVDEHGAWHGVLPLVHVQSRIFGSYLLSMPFLNYGGPLGSEPARQALAEDSVTHARNRGVRLLEHRVRHRPLEGLRTSDRKVTVTLPLPETVELLWQQTFRAKLRSQIRRPQKEGMAARFGADQVEPFYEVFAVNMRDLGTPVLPRTFFERVARTFPSEAIFGAVYAGERPVAAGCGFLWKGEFEMTWASSLRAFNRSAPNMLLYASFMEEMIRRGARLFNFGRCTPGVGTHRFKLQWGGTDEPLPWAQWAPGAVEATPSPERPVFRLATRAWQRLPLAVANRAGPWLARQLP